MSGRISLVAFLATLALTLPATWSRTGADGPEEGAAERPPGATLAFGDMSVAVALDRATIDAGEKVHVTLVATSDRRREGDVNVIIYGQTGSPMSRVMTPPEVVEKKSVHLVAQPAGGTARTIAFTLTSRTNRRGGPAGYGEATSYTVAVEAGGPEGSGSASAAIPVTVMSPEAYHLKVASVSGPDKSGRVDAVVMVTSVIDREIDGVQIGVNAPGFSADPVAPLEKLAAGESRTVRLTGSLSADSTGPVTFGIYGYASTGGYARATVTLRHAEPAPIAFAEPPPPAR